MQIVRRSALNKTAMTAEQQKRFRQLMLQYWDSRGLTGTPNRAASAITYPDVAEAVNLTQEQKKKLIAGDAPAAHHLSIRKCAIELRPRKADQIPKNLNVSFWPIVLQKSFCVLDHKISEP